MSTTPNKFDENGNIILPERGSPTGESKDSSRDSFGRASPPPDDSGVGDTGRSFTSPKVAFVVGVVGVASVDGCY